MAHAAIGIHTALHARLRQAEKALKSARVRHQRARAALLASTGAGAAARRMVVELSDREVRRAAAELTAAAEAVAAMDSSQIAPRQIPLPTAARAAPSRITAARAEAARVVQVAQPVPPQSPDGTGPLFAWARAHGAAAG